MTQVLGFSVFGVDWQFLKPFIVIGLAFGGVYALSGVGLVVLYRATGVLNLAFGAIGAAGALIAYYLLNHTGCPEWLAFTVCVLFGGVVNLAYGMVFGPAFARRDPLVKMMGTLGLALILLGLMAWRAPAGGAFARFLPLPSTQHHYDIFGTTVSLTQIISSRSRSSSPPPSASSCARRSSAPRCGRSRTTVRSPRRWECRCAGSRRRPGSAPGSPAAPQGSSSPTSSPRSTTRP